MATNALNVRKNNYFDNPKEYRIYTPLDICYYLYDITQIFNFRNILDICCGNGNLSLPYKQTSEKLIGIDIEKTNYDVIGEFLQLDFLNDHSKDEYLKSQDINLVVCNPPWNQCDGKKLYPYEIFKRIIRIFGLQIPIILFTPMGLRLNRRYGAKREVEFEKMFDKGLQLSSNISMPIDAFLPGNKEKGQQWEILIFNMHGIDPSYWYTLNKRNEYIKKAELDILINGYDKDFIESLIKEEHEEKPIKEVSLPQDNNIIYHQNSFLS